MDGAATEPSPRANAARKAVASAGLLLSVASAAWIDPANWPTYAVFLALAFAFSFVWLDSEAPASVPHMATATAFLYIAGPSILFLELMARLAAYPLLFAAASGGLIELPRALRPLAQADPVAARQARLDFASMLGVATIGSVVRLGVVWAATGIESLIAIIAMGEPAAYAVMGALSWLLPLPTGVYLTVAPQRLPAEDARIDVIVSALAIVPFLVLMIVYGWLEHGLLGAAAWSLTTLPPHWLMQLLAKRRHLLDAQHLVLTQATASLARKQQELEDFTYTVAHDLKAPLSAITMTADLLLDAHGGALPEAARRDVAEIMRRAGETENMIVELLRMVRVVTEPEPVEVVDLSVITARAVDMLRPHIAARDVRVEVGDALPCVLGQATKLGHVMSNLIGNALRFVPAGSGVVQVNARRDGPSVTIAVRDNGAGIPREYHEAIFEVFRRVPDNGDSAPGSGMGLAIVRRIVDAHGGNVTVQSAPGEGSVISVWLPAVR